MIYFFVGFVLGLVAAAFQVNFLFDNVIYRMLEDGRDEDEDVHY